MILYSILGIIICFGVLVFAYIQLPLFGGNPKKTPNKNYFESPNFQNGKFQNLEKTPALAEDASIGGLLYDQFFNKSKRRKPKNKIPSQKTDLKNLNPNENILVWFGHSSYFIQINGIKLLIDPVFSGNASPIPYSVTSFEGSDMYSVEDLPEIDVLLISHDHYDHLDYGTIVKLRHKVQKVICGLGVSAHFKKWDYNMKKVVEMDWNEQLEIGKNIQLYTFPARHFSGRKFQRANTLWLSFGLITPQFKLYLGADSGYGTHFKDIGAKIGNFDWAILDNGQYNKSWKDIHMMPHQVLQAAEDLHTTQLLPFHNSKFALALHDWDEPLNTITHLFQQKKYPFKLNTPMIGEKVDLNSTTQEFTYWWKDLEK